MNKGKANNILRLVLPFFKSRCLECGEEFGILNNLFRQHTVTGTRLTSCRKCDTVNYVDYDDKVMMYDIEAEEYVYQKGEGRKYMKDRFSIINVQNMDMIVFMVVLIWYIISSLIKLVST